MLWTAAACLISQTGEQKPDSDGRAPGSGDLQVCLTVQTYRQILNTGTRCSRKSSLIRRYCDKSAYIRNLHSLFGRYRTRCTVQRRTELSQICFCPAWCVLSWSFIRATKGFLWYVTLVQISQEFKQQHLCVDEMFSTWPGSTWTNPVTGCCGLIRRQMLMQTHNHKQTNTGMNVLLYYLWVKGWA